MKTALITGSSRGIGKAIAQRLAKEGYQVWITGRTAADVNATVQSIAQSGGLAQGFTGDLTHDKDIARLIAQMGGTAPSLDLLVANLGSGTGSAGWNIPTAEFKSVFETNFFASVTLCTQFIPQIKSDGSIVLISSIAGCMALPAPLAYTAAKAALLAYSKTLSDQLAPLGIRVNSVSPGNILFEGGSWDQKLKASSEKITSYIESNVPLKRFGKPEEIAEAVNYLAHAQFATGTNLVVDGGQTRAIR